MLLIEIIDDKENGQKIDTKWIQNRFVVDLKIRTGICVGSELFAILLDKSSAIFCCIFINLGLIKLAGFGFGLNFLFDHSFPSSSLTLHIFEFRSTKIVSFSSNLELQQFCGKVSIVSEIVGAIV